jgi:hypothetical protein
MAEPGISVDRARRHEALVVTLEALLREVHLLAARRPQGRVNAALRAAAEGLLFEAGQFAARRRREALPAVALTLGPLAVQLGQARAGLETFELLHASWSARHKAFAWRTRGGPVLVGRLKPAAADQVSGKLDRRRHAEILRQIDARLQRAYDEGFEDARTGRPHTGSVPWKRRA